MGAVGARPGVGGQGQRDFVHAGPQFDADLFAVPEREHVAEHGGRERACQGEGAAGVADVPGGDGQVLGDGPGLAAPGDGFDQQQRHGHGRGDAGGGDDAVVGHDAPVRDVADRRVPA
ncbi:hypothetical protein [Bordetella pertussis]|uniref:hypothetical protein n=4 Tax=Bordetella pertussis TaxID=520 RepID=UPI00139670C2|nr:hypothetical protein [Bordetella pertussis]